MNPIDPSLPRSEIRHGFKQRRKAMASEVRAQAIVSICDHLTNQFNQSNKPNADLMVGAYMATPEEVDLEPWLSEHLALGGHVALPRTDGGGVMHFHQYTTESRLINNRYGIQEPLSAAPIVTTADIDAVLVPMLAFDHAGTRLGMGGGYYDRYLPLLGARTKVIGVAFACQQSTELLPRERWDIPVHTVVTEHGVLEFH